MGVGEKFKGWILFVTPPKLIILNFIKIGPFFLLVPRTGPRGSIPGGIWGGAKKMRPLINFVVLDILNSHICIRLLNFSIIFKLRAFIFFSSESGEMVPSPPGNWGRARSIFFLYSDDFPHKYYLSQVGWESTRSWNLGHGLRAWQLLP